MLISTVPPPHYAESMGAVLNEPIIDMFRFNVGSRTPYTPKQTLEMILKGRNENETLPPLDADQVIVDLDGRQLRIIKWAYPGFGNIELNHSVKVDLSAGPASIIFRGNDKPLKIVAIKENLIFCDADPSEAIGAGQAVNIHGTNLEIIGNLTDEDKEYIKAAIGCGIHRYMISFTEEADDIYELVALDPKAIIYAKIESIKGLEFVKEVYPKLRSRFNIMLVAALDDLYINIGEDKTAIIEALELIIRHDSNAIAASRIFTSLGKSEIVSLSDLTGFKYLQSIGYGSFMLSDELCGKKDIFGRVVSAIRQYKNRFDGEK